MSVGRGTPPAILRIGDTFYVPEPLHEDHRHVAREVVPVDCEWSEMVAYHQERYAQMKAERDRAVEARENANAATLRAEHEVERLGALAREQDGFLHAIGKVIARHEASLDRDFDASTREANDGD